MSCRRESERPLASVVAPVHRGPLNAAARHGPRPPRHRHGLVNVAQRAPAEQHAEGDKQRARHEQRASHGARIERHVHFTSGRGRRVSGAHSELPLSKLQAACASTNARPLDSDNGTAGYGGRRLGLEAPPKTAAPPLGPAPPKPADFEAVEARFVKRVLALPPALASNLVTRLLEAQEADKMCPTVLTIVRWRDDDWRVLTSDTAVARFYQAFEYRQPLKERRVAPETFSLALLDYEEGYRAASRICGWLDACFYSWYIVHARVHVAYSGLRRVKKRKRAADSLTPRDAEPDDADADVRVEGSLLARFAAWMGRHAWRTFDEYRIVVDFALTARRRSTMATLLTRPAIPPLKLTPPPPPSPDTDHERRPAAQPPPPSPPSAAANAPAERSPMLRVHRSKSSILPSVAEEEKTDPPPPPAPASAPLKRRASVNSFIPLRVRALSKATANHNNNRPAGNTGTT